MSRFAILTILCLTAFTGSGQGTKALPALPMIDITLTDGERYTDRDLPYGPFVLIYFSPDCSHCKAFITSLIQREKAIKNRQILLISFVDVNTLKSFEEAMGLQKFGNIKTGTEGESYRIAKSLSIRKFPFVGLYNASRKLVRSFEGEQPFSQVVEAMEKL